MRVATWNINNVTKRLDLLLGWLDRTKPEVVALQELKTTTADFPTEALKAAGYESLAVGQRSWNGVALLARGHEPLPVVTALPGDREDKEARYVEAAVNGMLFACLYLPNGNPQPGPKFDYKLRWFERLRQRAAELWASGQPVVLLGDWNVVPTDADIYKPDTWRDNALLQPKPRETFLAIRSQGWTDALAKAHPTKTLWTFWDYRRKRWERDAGLRIDHILVGAGLTVVDAGVDRDERGNHNASDHAPVWAELRRVRASLSRKAASASTATAAAPLRDVPAAASLAASDPPLHRYNQKRDFGKTAEPHGTLPETNTVMGDQARSFVVQKHAASRLHYDFRLQLDGVLVSWAVPKGPSFDPADKRMAIHVEDHPVSYGSFEGAIPPKQYGAGTVIVWDNGTWEPVGDPRAGMAKGKLLFRLHGQKLSGLWELVKIAKGDEKQEPWILFKKRDEYARPRADYDVVVALPDSVIAKPLRPADTATAVATGADASARGAVTRGKAATGGPAALGAVQAPLPDKLGPQLATLATGVPSSGRWLYEIKYDGYRIMARIDKGKARLITRGGHDWSAKMPGLLTELEQLRVHSAWLDGEIVVLDERGTPDFNALQKAFDGRVRSDDIVFFLFDLPFFEGYDLRNVELIDRRRLLNGLLAEKGTDHVRYSADFEADAASILTSACRLGLEGVIAKRADSPYVSRRTESWLKLKCKQRQEFVVAAYTERSDGAARIGSLLLGVHGANGELISVGSVGTGWDTEEASDLKRKLAPLEVPQTPFAAGVARPGRWSKRVAGSERWVTPKLVAEVEFAEWTAEGQIRHASYVALRADKPARAITREAAKSVDAPLRTASAAASTGTGVKVSHGERVIDATTGLTKLDLVRYYESVAPWLLPHLEGRPVSLVRGPQGVAGQLFFQKHDDKLSIPGLRELDPALWAGHPALLEVPTAAAVATAAQMNVIEFHTWNSLAKAIDKPDRMIFDLDPGEGTDWSHIQEAAVLVRGLLKELGLQAWLKTSGGKGLHVVVPLTQKLDYATVKGFSQAVVQHLARVIPSRFVAKSGLANRIGKLFVDYLRNGHGATTAAAFSARARPGLGVSMPVAWDDLAKVRSGAQWTIGTAREHLSFQTVDPWADYWTCRQTLVAGIRALGLDDGKRR